MCAPRHVVGGCVLIRTGMATSLPMLRETSPAKLHRLPWCCERLCTRSSNLRHFSTHGWACEASGETCPRSEPFWRLNCFSLSPCRLCDGESLLSEHARPRPLLARWPHGLPFFSATFALRCPVQLADPPPPKNCLQKLLPKLRREKATTNSQEPDRAPSGHRVSRSWHCSQPLVGRVPSHSAIKATPPHRQENVGETPRTRGGI